ncbi:methionyl-tRNA formyltransferase [Candidatus Saccharibacteria bacterium]|nr:methionyl-tRNA formyltransferase [Candidatus Saccharibacteria bacterium]
MSKPKVIFFGNGMLADDVLEILEEYTDVIFHAHDKDDLKKVKELKKQHPEAHGILASFGVILKKDLLDLFEPEGILNIHPSELPRYRGPSPVETAILNRDRDFGVSIMKLVEKMDAGPIYYQSNIWYEWNYYKDEIYEGLATRATEWLVRNLENLPKPKPQNDKNATYTKKLDTSMSKLNPLYEEALDMACKFRAFEDFPKTRLELGGVDCIIIDAHFGEPYDESQFLKPGQIVKDKNSGFLAVGGADGRYFVITEIQPAGKKPMDTKSFINGYLRDKK